MQLTSEINKAYTLDPDCPIGSPQRKHMFGHRSIQEKHADIVLPPEFPDLKCRVSETPLILDCEACTSTKNFIFTYLVYMRVFYANHKYTFCSLILIFCPIIGQIITKPGRPFTSRR